MLRHFFPAMAGLLFVAACGGTTAPVTTTDPFEAQADKAAADYARVGSFSETSIVNMPTSGGATFKGPAGIGITRGLTSQGDPDYLVLGDATMTARFDTAKMTGSVTNLRAIKPLGANRAVRTEVTGGIPLGGDASSIGDFAGTSRVEQPNDWLSTYDARLKIDGQDFAAQGLATGKFKGNRVGNAPGTPPMNGIVGRGIGIGTLGGAPARIVMDLSGTN